MLTLRVTIQMGFADVVSRGNLFKCEFVDAKAELHF